MHRNTPPLTGSHMSTDIQAHTDHAQPPGSTSTCTRGVTIHNMAHRRSRQTEINTPVWKDPTCLTRVWHQESPHAAPRHNGWGEEEGAGRAAGCQARLGLPTGGDRENPFWSRAKSKVCKGSSGPVRHSTGQASACPQGPQGKSAEAEDKVGAHRWQSRTRCTGGGEGLNLCWWGSHAGHCMHEPQAHCAETEREIEQIGQSHKANGADPGKGRAPPVLVLELPPGLQPVRWEQILHQPP